MKAFLFWLLLALLPLSASLAQTPNYFGTTGTPNPVPSLPPTPTAKPAAASPTPTSAPIPTPSSRIMTEDNFRAFLAGTVWDWGGRSNHPETLTFYADGTAGSSSGWSAKVVVRNIHEVQLQINHDTAKMTFNQAYTGYEGVDFDKKWPLQGKRLK